MARVSSRTSRRPAPLGCSRMLTIALLPLLIYGFQLLGKASTVASVLAALLFVLKVILELRQARQQPYPRKPRARPPVSRVSRPAQTALAGCYFCEELRVLRPYRLEGIRVGICQECSHSLLVSRWARSSW
jgi:hypothetical protein